MAMHRFSAGKLIVRGNSNNTGPSYNVEHPLNLLIGRTPTEKQKLMAVIPPRPTVLPSSVDLRSRMPPVYNQGALGSCTANALCALVQFLDPRLQGSRLFVYYNERRKEGTIPDDAGAYLFDGISTLETYGVCPETMWPYNISKFAEAPPNPCYVDAETHQTLVAQTIPNNATTMKNALDQGIPFCVGILVYPAFVSASVSKTGTVPMPSGRPLGGHAVVVVGYNDKTQRWILRNSWGTSWGDKGYFTLPYAYLLNQAWASDMWMIKQVEMPTVV